MAKRMIRELRDSSALVGDRAAIRERFDHDGYVFVRDFLDPDLIAWARERFSEKLAEEGLIAPDDRDLNWSGKPADPSVCDTLGRTIWSRVIADPKLTDILQGLFEAPPFFIPIVRHRCSLPVDAAQADDDVFDNRHQDGFFNEGMDFTICWIPMMDVPRARGGLAVAEGAHGHGYLHAQEPPYAIPAESIDPDCWRTADFRPGDVLIFNKSLPHAGMRNHTGQVRLSLDLRVIAEGAKQPVCGTVTALNGATVVIRTDEGEEVSIEVDENTFIRDMRPRTTVPLAELEKVARPGARVLATADANARATLMRPLAY